ncbi:MAG: TIGR01620 family protein [Rhizobiaceae bacterium]
MTTAPRKPAAFKIDPEPRKAQKAGARADKPRRPTAVRDEERVVFALPENDPFEEEIEALEETAPAPRRRFRLGSLFVAAAGMFLSLAIGLWVEDLITGFFARSEWLGWAASGLAAIAGLALLAIVAREAAALFRLRSVARLQTRAADAATRNDIRAARQLVHDVVSFTGTNPATAGGREALAGFEHEVIDGADLVAIAERELFGHLDRQAKALVLQAAKRVSVITAVSPRALVDVGYVLFESGRLIRRLSELYGGRPGTLGFFKLIRDVAAHLAVTGSIAVGDSLVQQLVGHGLAAKLSARLGEGVVNGLMTVRIGIAAMETVRPLPFSAVKRPGMGEFLTALASTSAAAEPPRAASGK